MNAAELYSEATPWLQGLFLGHFLEALGKPLPSPLKPLVRALKDKEKEKEKEKDKEKELGREVQERGNGGHELGQFLSFASESAYSPGRMPWHCLALGASAITGEMKPQSLLAVRRGLFSRSQGGLARVLGLNLRPLGPVLGIVFQQIFVKRLPDHGGSLGALPARHAVQRRVDVVIHPNRQSCSEVAHFRPTSFFPYLCQLLADNQH